MSRKILRSPLTVCALLVIIALLLILPQEQKQPGFLTMALTGRRDMIYVPPGPFIKGGECNPAHKRNILPAKTVELPGFYIDRHLTTNRDYAQFARVTGHRLPPHWKNGTYPAGQEYYPVYCVN